MWDERNLGGGARSETSKIEVRVKIDVCLISERGKLQSEIRKKKRGKKWYK